MFKFVVLLAAVACVFGASIPDPDGMPSQLDGRIVGGSNTSISKHPYQISLQWNGTHICGGSLYSRKVVITAAHCLQNVGADLLKVRVGSSRWNSGGRLVGVDSFKVHPNFDSWSMNYDIAIIKLSSPVTLGANVRRIALASIPPSDGTDAVVTGWGISSPEAIISTNLQQVTVQIISNAKCASNSYEYGSSHIRETMICAAAAGKDSCLYDSGGPLVVNGVQVGVVSWGNGCAHSNYPGVYSDVTTLRPWVLSNV